MLSISVIERKVLLFKDYFLANIASPYLHSSFGSVVLLKKSKIGKVYRWTEGQMDGWTNDQRSSLEPMVQES